MKERERKFLLKYMPNISNKIEIQQGYLILDENKHLRVRIIDNKNAYLTYKIFKTHEDRDEYEYEIPLIDAIELMASTKDKLNKTRFSAEHNGNNVYIDIYRNGLAVVEIEYDNELESKPNYCGQEITGDDTYSNISIALFHISI